MIKKYTHITSEERFLIEKMLKERKSISYIARLLSRSKSSVSNEISRNRGRSRYKQFKAAERYYARQTLKKRKSNAVVADSVTRKRVDRMLAKGMSPEQISKRIREHKSSKSISAKSIRKYRQNYYKH
ncbi:MAG TPA: helix-turn-helix domain-containing protein [Parcubacteria group bacterium]|jgi:IS30 family transposase|nr:helix-turn-helix domain-containing protein [Parcubacteria group bacterium]